LFLFVATVRSALAAGDATQGAQLFRNCLACHSTEPGVNMTGPSLAGIFGRKAGSFPSFHRYSDALKLSGIVWDDQTLDAWLRNPAALVPGNEMPFPGIPDANARSNLIAYLHQAATVSMPAGMNMQRGLPDLKTSPPDARVKSVGYCDDTYTVVTGSGQTRKFWEFNLRFKTDSSAKGPRSDEPVLVPQGMAGDRAQIVFSSPDEMTTFIKRDCPKG
jgi:cytochrome c